MELRFFPFKSVVQYQCFRSITLIKRIHVTGQLLYNRISRMRLPILYPENGRSREGSLMGKLTLADKKDSKTWTKAVNNYVLLLFVILCGSVTNHLYLTLYTLHCTVEPRYNANCGAR